MSELSPETTERQGVALDRHRLVEKLTELDIDVTLEGFADQDDNEVLATLAMLAQVHDYDIEEILKVVADIEEFGDESVDTQHIVGILERCGITVVTVADLSKLDIERMQRLVVWHLKEVQLDYETIGKECFGKAWDEGRWQ